MDTVLKLEHIQKFYGKEANLTKAIKDISFSVQKGEFLSIMGASGSGKTTLLNGIRPKDLARFRRENLGFVFQDYNLLDALTVSENIALALAINHVPEDSISGRVAEIAETLQISDILEKYPYQVSGGQKQRCACARDIVSSPKLLLADEPTGALDSHASQVLLETMQDINRRYGATILMVTHDAVSASYAGRTVFLKDGEVYTEIYKGEDSRRAFFEKIMDIQGMMGGGQRDVC